MSFTTYRLKEKGWTLRDVYEIKNQEDEVVYKIRGKLVSISNKYFFENAEGEELLMIKRQLISLRPSYKIFREGKLLAVIEKKWSLWRSSFKVDIPGPNDYEISGKFWKREYEFERKGKVVAEVSKKFWSWSDSFGVKIEEDEDHELILATVLVLNLQLKDMEQDAEAGDGN